MEDLIDGCDGTAAAVAGVVAYHLAPAGSRWVFTGASFMRFDGTLWADDGDGVRLRAMIQEEVTPLFARRVEYYGGLTAPLSRWAIEQAQKQAVSLSKAVGRLGDARFLDRVAFSLRSELLEAGFLDRLDTAAPHLVAFTNGVWDLERHAFRRATPEDLLSVSTGYPFIPVKDEAVAAEVASYLARVFPDPAWRARVLGLLARHLNGAPEDCRDDDDYGATAHVGQRGSGKSLFFRALGLALGAYAVQFDAEMLKARAWSGAPRPAPELAAWRACRILYSSDMANGRGVLNDAVLRKLTSGEELHFRMLYEKARAFRPMFRLHLLCGPEHHAACSPNLIHYTSRFTSKPDEVDRHVFPQDPRLDEWLRLPATRMELFRYLVKNQKPSVATNRV